MAASSFFFLVFLVLQSGHKEMLLLCNSWQLLVMSVANLQNDAEIVWVWFLLHSFLWSFYFVFIFSFFPPHITCFLLSVPVPWSGKGRGEAGSITVPANTPWAPAMLTVPSLTPFQPSLQQFFHPSPYNPLTPLRQKASRCAVGMPFLRTIIYFLAVVGTLVQIHHNFQFYKNSCYCFLPVAHNLSLNSFCTKFLCESGFNLF